VAAGLIQFARSRDYRILVFAEYGILPVERAIPVNRILRQAGLLSVRPNLSWELLDFGRSRAFAVADHQIAHVYVKDKEDVPRVRELLKEVPGVAQVGGEEEKKLWGIDHPRAGELVAVAEPNAWFAYPWWLSEDKAPDFARTVDIHRKPGYDPLELFWDRRHKFPRLRAALKLFARKMGFRTLLDVVPLDLSLVRGSHGRADLPEEVGPVAVSSEKKFALPLLKAEEGPKLIERLLFE